MTRNFTLNLCEQNRWISRFDEIMNLKRRYQSISLTLHSSVQPYVNIPWTGDAVHLLLQVMAKHGSSIRKMTLSHAEFETSTDFYGLLSSVPLLNHLSMHRVKFNVEKERIDNRTILTELTNLNLTTCDWNVFKAFMSSPIKTLQLSNKFSFVDAKQFDAYTAFLNASTKLESIEFDFASYGKTFRVPLVGSDLRLKKLKYLSFSPAYEIDEIDANFGTFLASQASSLTELDLNYVGSDLIKIIFTKLTRLEKLRLNASVLPANREFYGPFKQMAQLKELTLHDNLPSEIAVKEILVRCGGLQSLIAHHDPNQYVPSLFGFIAANSPSVKRLSLDALSEVVSPDGTFTHLKYLHIQVCSNLNTVIDFLNINSTVETLSLILADDTSADGAVIDELLKCPNLRHLIIAATHGILNGIYQRVKVDYKKLKSLELGPLPGAADKVFIRFPEDRSEWKPSEHIFP